MTRNLAYQYLLVADDDPAIDYKERERRRQHDAKSLCDIGKLDNPADAIVTITLSGNALNSVLNTAQSSIQAQARLEASQYPGATRALELYAIIDQMRDQMSEERMRNRDGQAEKTIRPSLLLTFAKSVAGMPLSATDDTDVDRRADADALDRLIIEARAMIGAE